MWNSSVKKNKTKTQKILVIEDEPSIQHLCSEILTLEGFEVDVAANGMEAKLKLKRRDYNLLIIDVKMPGMNGVRLHEYMAGRCPEMLDRSVFISGDVIGGDTEIFLKNTGRPFLAKPFNPDELTAIVKKTIRLIEK